MPGGIPNYPEPVVSYCRHFLRGLLEDLKLFVTFYPGNRFTYGCGLLLLLPIRKVLQLFMDEENFSEERAEYGGEMKRIWALIPGSGKIPLPYEA